MCVYFLPREVCVVAKALASHSENPSSIPGQPRIGFFHGFPGYCRHMPGCSLGKSMAAFFPYNKIIIAKGQMGCKTLIFLPSFLFVYFSLHLIPATHFPVPSSQVRQLVKSAYTTSQWHNMVLSCPGLRAEFAAILFKYCNSIVD